MINMINAMTAKRSIMAMIFILKLPRRSLSVSGLMQIL